LPKGGDARRLFESLTEDALTHVGIANGNSMSVRAAAFQAAGHELHHLESIRANHLAWPNDIAIRAVILLHLGRCLF